jgi:hypothetical protein
MSKKTDLEKIVDRDIKKALAEVALEGGNDCVSHDIRLQHYFFVQNNLYNFIDCFTKDSLEMFSSDRWLDRMGTYLRNIWNQVYDEIIELDPESEKIEIQSLPFTVTKIDLQKNLVVITLPEPQAMTESYFIGICYETNENKSNTKFRYFTLEYHDIDRSAICEINNEGHHLFGIGKILSQEEFIEAIKGIVGE